MLSADPYIRLVACAPLYRASPVGPVLQPDFYNSVLGIDTDLTATELLALCQEVESALGRKRDVRWGARVIDIDILLFGDTTLTTPTLTLPHPQIQHRAFVLLPLKDLDPSLEIPGLGSIQALLAALPPQQIEQIAAANWTAKSGKLSNS